MKEVKVFQSLVRVLTALLTVTVITVNGQISTPCTTSIINSFTPCLNFITGSSSNGSSPTTDCCGVVKTIMSTSVDCACLIITGNVPVQLPFNRTLAISLPRACKMAGVPIKCKSSGSPLPAPGPALFGPPPPPAASSPFSPQASKAVALAPAPETETTSDSPAFAPAILEAPTASTGIRPVLTPSASNPSHTRSPILLVIAGAMAFKLFNPSF